jgi:polyhydroxybutyrate depolymerase
MTTLVALAAMAQAGGETVTFKVGDVERTALVFAPTKKTENPPVLFMFHGHGGGSRQAAVQWRYHLSWPEAVVVYPQGLPGWAGRTDPEGKRSGWQGAPGQLDDRDIKFTDAMLAWAAKEWKATPSRTFATGHSNGSLMTWVLQTKRADKFAAFAGACAPGSLWYREAPAKPAFVVAGVEDELVGIRGMRIFADAVVRKNECSGTPTLRGDGIKVYRGKSAVWIWEYDGGHTPPRNCGEKVVEFFKSV